MRLIQANFKRTPKGCALYVKVHSSVQRIFSQGCEVAQSSEWTDMAGNPLSYYRGNLDRSLSRGSIETSNYGTRSIYSSGLTNASILRSVGIEKGVTLLVKQPLSKDDMSLYLSELSSYVKYLYEQKLRPVVVELTVSVKGGGLC